VSPRIRTAARAGGTEIRWWTVEELEASDEVFAPSRLAALVGELLRPGPSADPIGVGV
jgi:hypothetical protein